MASPDRTPRAIGDSADAVVSLGLLLAVAGEEIFEPLLFQGLGKKGDRSFWKEAVDDFDFVAIK